MAGQAHTRPETCRLATDNDHRVDSCSDSMSDLDSLTLERDVLRQRVAELESIISGDINTYLGLGVTIREAKVIGALMRRDVLTLDHMRILLDADEGHDRNAYIVLMKRLRAKLAPRGISIATRRGAGYYLAPFDKKVIQHIVRLFVQEGK